MNDAPHLWFSVPAWLLYAWVALEGAAWVARRRAQRERHPAWGLALWAVRPWAGWAAFNLLFRWRWAAGFNNRRTFPFFANLWDEKASLGEAIARLTATPTVWLWGLVVLVVAGGLAWAAWRWSQDPPPDRRRRVAALLALYAAAFVLYLAVAALPNGTRTTEAREGSLLSCWHAHATMLYTVPVIKSTGHYLRNFLDLQPQLRKTIHGLSHPPGASLSMYYIGCATGVRGEDIRLESTRLRYAVGLTLFGALNVLVVFALARSLFRDDRVAWLAALLWLSAPSVTTYGTFAQDTLYAVFFNLSLLLTYAVATRERRPWPEMLLLGCVFFCVVLLNYSWCLLTTIFAVFTVYGWRRARRPFLDLVVRGVVPLGLMTVLAGGLLLYYRLNYLAMYKVSSDYVALWYRFEGVYQHLTAWVGGQFDLWLLMGSVTCSAFLVALSRLRPRDLGEPAAAFLLLILVIFALPVLFGPTCLRMETARCWNWVAAVPFAFAARELAGRPASRLFAAGAVAVSIATSVALRLFLNFAP
jgi:hypothetical protein